MALKAKAKNSKGAASPALPTMDAPPLGIDLEAVERSFVAEQTRRLAENKLAYYKPYPKQKEFHEAGATKRERLLMAANQVGKTWAGGFELAMHATGRYPEWWRGRRFDRPIVAWAC